MKARTVYILLPLCLCVGPVMGQTPSPHMLHKNVSDGSYVPPTSAQLAIMEQAGQLAHDAAADLHLGNYALAESEARQSLAIEPGDGVPAEVLPAALEAQGKDTEALQAYKTEVEHYDRQPRNLLPYAQLLLKSGQWAQAVAIYNEALPHLPSVGPHPESPIVQDGDLLRANSQFSVDVLEPAALATALHIARGIVYNATTGWARDSLNTEAMAEYAKALQLAPDNALANYYYGVGWHKLSPAERVKFGHAAQAKASLQKAAQSDAPSVKKMAAETLKQSN